LLIGALGGLGIGAIAGARRTQSAFPSYLAKTSASDLQVGVIPRSATAPVVYSPALTASLAHLRGVRRVGAFPFMLALPMKPNGAPSLPDPLNNNEISTIGSVNGEYFEHDRVAVTRGRMANPHNADEFVMTAQAAQLLRWHIGQEIPFGVFTAQQSDESGFGTARVPPAYRVTAKLVGTVMFSSQVVRDEADQYPTFVLFTPALTNRVLTNATYLPTYALTLVHGGRDVTITEQAVLAHLPKGYEASFHVTATVEGQVERATRPESIALGIFGLIAVIAALLVAAQAISRQQQSSVATSTSSEPSARIRP
jgi:hypothetical protein